MDHLIAELAILTRIPGWHPTEQRPECCYCSALPEGSGPCVPSYGRRLRADRPFEESTLHVRNIPFHHVGLAPVSLDESTDVVAPLAGALGAFDAQNVELAFGSPIVSEMYSLASGTILSARTGSPSASGTEPVCSNISLASFRSAIYFWVLHFLWSDGEAVKG